jgi:hypothetical protein
MNQDIINIGIALFGALFVWLLKTVRPNDSHEFMALEANSRIVNINKGLG